MLVVNLIYSFIRKQIGATTCYDHYFATNPNSMRLTEDSRSIKLIAS